MSLSPKNLASIQKAGQAVHDACTAIADRLRSQAEGMVASMASQPFGVESEQQFARFKVLARLSQVLSAVEGQLQELYALASDLAHPAPDLVALPQVSRKARASAALTPNDRKLLNYLQKVLRTDAWTAHTGAMMAAGSGLPLGSVGISLKKVLASGAVVAGKRGMFQLGRSSG